MWYNMNVIQMQLTYWANISHAYDSDFNHLSLEHFAPSKSRCLISYCFQLQIRLYSIMDDVGLPKH
jgi:hypothetical protein